MLKMDVTIQQKPCSCNVEIPGGRGVIKDPLGKEIPKGWGGCKPKTFRGRGMDIFWNHTMKRLQGYNELFPQKKPIAVFVTNRCLFVLQFVFNQLFPTW